MTSAKYNPRTPGHFLVLGFTLFYIAAAAIYFWIAGVREFLMYLIVLLIIVVAVTYTLKYSKLPIWALWGLSLLGLLHALGGGVKVHGDLLYNLILVPIINQGPNGITIWRFDQLVHPYGTFIAALVVYYFIAPGTKLSRIALGIVVALAAMGLGSLNEVVEFFAKLTIPNTDVGGYDNTLLDLCSNTLGSTVGALFATLRWGKTPPVDGV